MPRVASTFAGLLVRTRGRGCVGIGCDDFGEEAEGAGEKVIGLGQDAGELRIVLFDVAHGGIDLRADVIGFGCG